jgi:hypothetical protein
MKKVIQGISVFLIALGLIAFLYGSIKLARVEAQETPEKIISGVPNIEVIQSSPISQETAQIIIGVSIIPLIFGGVGLWYSTKMSRL